MAGEFHLEGMGLSWIVVGLSFAAGLVELSRFTGG